MDEAAEQQRAGKRREEIIKQIAIRESRLANKGYTDKAPPQLVKQTQDELAALREELSKLQ